MRLLLTNLILLGDLRQCSAFASQSAECDDMVGNRSFFSDHSLLALFLALFKPGNCLVFFTAGSCLVLLTLSSKRYISTISSSGSSSSASSSSSSALR